MGFHIISAVDWRLAIAALYIVGMGLEIASFSRRYMDGAVGEKKFWAHAALLLAGAIASVLADHIAILILAWWIPCLSLPQLILAARHDPPAAAAARTARRTLLLGSITLSLAFTYGAFCSGSPSLVNFVAWLGSASQIQKMLVLSGLVFASIAQSGIFPLNRWLVGTASAPTPVSALMHAGIVNGGGILLIRIAPVLAASEGMRITVIVLGLSAATMSALSTLASHDYKRGLASSTSTQMAFVLVQIGLGATTAALIHLMLHGTFKALMFLNMANVQHGSNQRQVSTEASIWAPLIVAALGGIFAWQLPGSAPWIPSILLLSHWIFAASKWSDPIGPAIGKGVLLILALVCIHYVSLFGPNLPEITGARPIVDLALLMTTVTIAVIRSRPSRQMYLAALNAGQAPL